MQRVLAVQVQWHAHECRLLACSGLQKMEMNGAVDGCCILLPLRRRGSSLQEWGSVSGCATPATPTGSSESGRGGSFSGGLLRRVGGWPNHGSWWVRLPVKAALWLWSELSTTAPTGVATLLEASICSSHAPFQHAPGETPDLVFRSDDGGARLASCSLLRASFLEMDSARGTCGSRGCAATVGCRSTLHMR